MNQEVEKRPDPIGESIKKTAKGIKGLKIHPLAAPIHVTQELLRKEIEPLLDEYYEMAITSGQLPAKIKGFRDGKIPKDVMVQKLGGMNKFYEPVLGELLQQLMMKAGKKICVYDNLALNNNLESGFSLSATVYLYPKVKLPKSLTFLKTLEISEVDKDLVAGMVENEIDKTLLRFATYEEDNSPVATGHKVTVKVTTQCGKKTVKNRTGIFSEITNSDPQGPWWQSFVIGLKQNDQVTQTFVETDPNSRFYDENLEAQIKVQAVQKVIRPKIEGKFLESLGVRTENAWRTALFTRFFNLAKQEVDRKLTLAAIDSVLLKSKIDPVPGMWIDSIVHQSIHNTKQKIGEKKLFQLYGVSNLRQLKAAMGQQLFIETRDEMVIKAFAEKIGVDAETDGWRPLAEKEFVQYIHSLKEEASSEKVEAEKENKKG